MKPLGKVIEDYRKENGIGAIGFVVEEVGFVGFGARFCVLGTVEVHGKSYAHGFYTEDSIYKPASCRCSFA